MTLISRIKSNISRIYHIKRYRWEVWSAYVLSAMITFLAILVDSLPYKEVERCDSFRPRFGESQCFFSGKIVYYICIVGLQNNCVNSHCITNIRYPIFRSP